MQGGPAAPRGQAVLRPEQAAQVLDGNAVDLGLATVGSLDLGGSSLEVTYMPTDAASQHAATSAHAPPRTTRTQRMHGTATPAAPPACALPGCPSCHACPWRHGALCRFTAAPSSSPAACQKSLGCSGGALQARAGDGARAVCPAQQT